jgi:predicted RNA binding protein YcfA (HicA-like mRNA interferase family)
VKSVSGKQFARISLPIHKNDDLKVGLLKHFMKVAGISETEL